MWHFMNHGLIETFDVVLEELSYYQKTDKSDILIKGIEFEPVEMASFTLLSRLLEKNKEDIDDVVDEYWEKKLPDEYQRYIEMSDMPLDYTTKKDLYLSLCQGFLGCNGQVWFSLCKSTSGICSILPAAHIISPNRNLETRYLSQSRFKEVVRLEIQYDYCFSCRLGSFMFSPHHTYACYLVFRYKDNQVPSNDASFYTAKCNSRDNIMIQGQWFMMDLMAERSANHNYVEESRSSKSIDGGPGMSKHNYVDRKRSWVEKRDDGWLEARLTKPLLKHDLEYHLDNRTELEMYLSEIKDACFNGMIVEGVLFKPVVVDNGWILSSG
ncbi:serine-threonine/tyrosine-protein kinase catalytic domain-containing protein [Tanacetum coccineum]